LVGRSKGKIPLGRPRHKWEDNIKMDLMEIGIDGANWIHLARDGIQWRAFVNTLMNFWFHNRQRISCINEPLLTSEDILFHRVSLMNTHSQKQITK